MTPWLRADTGHVFQGHTVYYVLHECYHIWCIKSLGLMLRFFGASSRVILLLDPGFDFTAVLIISDDNSKSRQFIGGKKLYSIQNQTFSLFCFFYRMRSEIQCATQPRS